MLKYLSLSPTPFMQISSILTLFKLTFIHVEILENGVMRLQKRCNTISLDFACLCFFQSFSYVSLV